MVRFPPILTFLAKDASTALRWLLSETSLKNIIFEPSVNSPILSNEASVPLPPSAPPEAKIFPFTERSPIIINEPSTGPILLKDASLKVACSLKETSLKKVIPELTVDSCIISKDASVRVLKT